MIIYNIDMDGCLAQWDDVSVEETFEKGYFLNRPAEEILVEAVKMMIKAGCDVNILSCAYNNGLAMPEKNAWLDKHLGKTGYTRTFVPYGDKKEKCMRKADVNILLDDYSQNLHSWEKAGNLGFKFYWSRGGRKNGTKGTWRGYSVNDKMTPNQIMTVLTTIAKKEETKNEN